MEFTHFSFGPSSHGDSIKVMSLYYRRNSETAGNIPWYKQHPSLSSCYYFLLEKGRGVSQESKATEGEI